MNEKDFQPGELVDLPDHSPRWGSFRNKQVGLVLGWRYYPDGDHCVKVLWNDGEETNTHPMNLVKL
jgi:hypothetical protein